MHAVEGTLPRIVQGRVWKFGDDISTDLLAPGAYAVAPLEERKRHVLESVNPRFPEEVRPGDIVVAGRNFGCGSSRETAPEGLKALGVGCVVAESFSRLFFRNAIAIGLPVLPCPGVVEAFEEGDPAEVEIAGALVRNLRTGQALWGRKLPPAMLEVLAAGGILPLLKARGQQLSGTT
ncbi:MAG: 3-isopropylmalate dehydratase [Armatimonadota bacterium]|nr:3-isopropylmalate dehydratase [Armatimonadota bacterium]